MYYSRSIVGPSKEIFSESKFIVFSNTSKSINLKDAFSIAPLITGQSYRKPVTTVPWTCADRDFSLANQRIVSASV